MAFTTSSIEGKPRASGDDPGLSGSVCLEPGVNPARAGMIPRRLTCGRRRSGKPRASGDDPGAAVTVKMHAE